jgi:hypothetical protein
LWECLAKEDPARAYDAVWTLIDNPGQSVPFLAKQLQLAVAGDRQTIARLIGELDSNQFAVRQRATKQLEVFGELAEPALREAARGRLSKEAKSRVERLLDRCEREVLTPEQVRGVRALEVLEIVGTPEALKVLRRLAGGAPEAGLTQEAKETLARLARGRVKNR